MKPMKLKRETDGLRKKVAVNYAAFVRTWQESDSVAEVSEKMEKSIANVRGLASKLRKEGVKALKRFPKAKRYNVAELQEQAEALV
jgi:transposase